MKSTAENLAPTRVKLVVEVPYAELRPSIDKAYKTISNQVNIPGFRRGKVPPPIIDQRVGRAAVLQEAVNDALPELYRQAVAETEIRPLGQPEVDIAEVPDPGTGAGDLKFSAEVDVRPDFELPDPAAISVSVDTVEVTDEDVDARLDELRTRFASLAGVERPAAEGDFVSLDLRAVIDGDEVDSATGVSYEVGSKTMLDGLDDVLVGLSAGEETIYTTTLAGGEHAGEEAEVTVAVQAVKERVLPEADDDFAQLASEFDTVDELRVSLRGDAEQAKRLEQGVQAREAVLKALIDAVEIPVPPAMVEEEVTRHLEGEGRLADDEHRAEVTSDTERSLRGQFLLDSLAEKEQVQVQQQELIQFLVSTSRQYGMTPQDFVQAVEESGQMPSMIGEVARRKALALAMSKATVTDSDGTVIDLDQLLGRQSAGVPGEDATATGAGSEATPTSGDTSADTVADAAGPAPDAPVVGSTDSASAVVPDASAAYIIEPDAAVADAPDPTRG